MKLFEIIIICVVAAMFFAATFVFIVCTYYIKQVHKINQQVVTLTNVIFECRSFLEKLSKHDVITKINNIIGLENKIIELLSICKNQTNNITQVGDNLYKSLEDIKMKNKTTNTFIKDNHKLLDNINVKTSKMKDDINKIGEIVTDINKSTLKYDKAVENITYITDKLGEVNVDSEKYVNNINEKLEEILSWTRICIGGIESLIDGHNKAIDALEQLFEVVNTKNDVTRDTIDKTYNDVKSILKDIAKISSILDTYREKINYITTYIENTTKLKTASKTKIAQTKTTTTLANKKSVQK